MQHKVTAPFSPETEQAVLGCVLAHPAAFRDAAGRIGNRRVFFDERHSTIWQTINAWYADHDTPPDGTVLVKALPDDVAYISTDIVNRRCLAANIGYHVHELLRLWKLRTARDAAGELARCADNQNMDVVEKILSELNTDMIETESESPLNPMPVKDAPVPEAPVFTGGIVPGNMGILAAVDGSGKSFLCLSIAMNVVTARPIVPSLRARKRGSVMVLSYEDSPGNIRLRMSAIAEQSGINCGDIFEGIHFFFPEVPLFMPTRDGTVQPTGLYHDLDSEAARIRPDMIIIDPYSGASGVPENNNEMGAAIGQHLNTLAKKHNTAVLVVHHVGKGQVDSESHLAMRGNSGLPSKARWIARLLSTDTPNGLRLHVAKDSYHRRAGDVYFERTDAGPLREITGAEIGKAMEALSVDVVNYVASNPEQAITLNAIRLNNSKSAKALIAAMNASPAEVFRAAEYAIAGGDLSVETRPRPNRGGTYEVLVSESKNEDSEVPF